MAKKKLSRKKEAAPMAEPANVQITTSSNGGEKSQTETKDVASRDTSPDRTEKLKQLNEILLKQTVEKREQVSQLQSQIEEMGIEFSFASEMEWEIFYLVTSAFVINLSIEINERLKGMGIERQKEVERVRVLEGEVESLKEEVQAEKKKGRLVEMEKTEVLDKLDKKEEEVIEMQNMVKELEIVKSGIENNMSKVSAQKDALERDVKEKDVLISNLTNEKKGVENELSECKKLVDKLKIEVEEEVKDKQSKVGSLENVKEALEAKIVSLEEEHALEISRFNSQAEGLSRKISEKETEIGDLRATIQGKNEKIVGLEKEIDILHLAIEEAKKRSGFWSWIYPAATTILAAISFVYAAKAR